MRTLAAILMTVIGAVSAQAADEQPSGTKTDAGDVAMAALLQDGFEIKAATQNGRKFIVFLQKDTAAYVCEFSSLNTSRCGALN